ncbi:hypothetical protein M758_11G167500 [Ceratodon purpureus]|uniref:Uncharacterized protein n=1 Tax=Ceratodon purpureus TaxID=3225 RepID=A0A8T0GIL1_CERPU|nr:hypothetical protein KC19_11G171600 [Ceratodon purpureus]KAG0602206.1 hypothetical protein M758_11G167500 [Ceratodon purpureus]
MDGQLGRQRAASYPAPINFSGSSTTSFDESRKYTTSRSQDSRNSDGFNVKVTMVDAGGMMSSAIDQEGGLWLWGAVPQPSADAQSPQSNPFEPANIDKPERVLAFAGHKVRRVSCGSEHILALVDSRGGAQCYSWGGNANGQLGVGDFEPRGIPTKITSLAVQQVGTIVDFACGFFHSVVVTAKDGESSDQESESSSMARRNPHLMDQVMASPKLRGRITPEQYMESPRVRSKQGYPYSVPNSNSRISNRSFSVHSDTSSRAQSQSSVSSWAGNSVRAQVARREAQVQAQAQLPISGGSDARMSSCWTFGQGENGQLGNGSRANSHTPAVVEALPTHERIQAVACGLFHTAVVTESGDVWVWGMEGGLGQCPGIGPPGSKSGDALTPVRVFGESSARCNPLSGSKGIACGAAHTVTVANGGRDLWSWGRGKNGVLGLGHASDSWFPSPVIWPPGTQPSGSKYVDAEGLHDVRKSSWASSRGGSRGRGDEIRPYVREVDDNKPPRSNSFSRLPGEQQQQQYLPEVREVETERPPRGIPSHRKAIESPGRPRRDPVMESPGRPSNARREPVMQSPGRPSRRGDQFWPPMQPEPENPRALRRDSGSEPSSTSMRAFKYQIGDALQEEDVTVLKLELAECRRYAEGLHVAVYGGLDTFALPLQGKNSSYYDSEFDSRIAGTKSSALQDWHQHVDEAPLEELAKLEQFYKGMRNRLKDLFFQRKMEDWYRRVQSGFTAASYQEPPPVREPYSVQSTPYFNDPGELALRMSGILSDRGEMLPPAALAASIAEFRMHSQRRR